MVISTLLIPIVTPIALVIALTWDVVTRTPRLRRSRVVILISTLILEEFLGRIVIFATWLISPFGTRVQGPKSQARYRYVMTKWASTLLGTFSRIMPLPIDTSELDDSLLGGNAIVIGRHRSLLDAVVPATVFGKRGLAALYTMKDSLQWAPNIDIVGQRMGHVFVSRSSNDLEGELEPIRKLAARIDDNSVGVIFPEGTFFTEKRKQRALKSIAKRNPERLSLAERLNYVLPPRPGGTLALLEGAPNADVVLLGHVGFEPFGSLGQIIANAGSQHRIHIRAWRFARDTIPTDVDAQVQWLFERWAELDEWIASKHPLPGVTAQYDGP